ncbi:hypothetical protein RHGRI_021459 [Rhododendron griersonianum]|uniref:Gnk2-homologous domain-containing protein n=1 Tax=Rhododendron griersonianum TaxID=479676 RepID=A0AAV6JKA6_9ERIC|nr:hypothetical protein RHGRI_021459 [Rhododendron griersonianum]
MATMGSWRELLLLLFLYLFLVNIESTFELGSWINLIYFDTGSGNYSSNSTYQTNLNTLLSSLSNRTDRYGFYSSSFGDNPDRVYAIVLCRGDVELHTCRSCIKNSTIKLPQLLPNSKGAIGWYGYCMLRYSDKSMNGIKVTYPYQVLYSGVNASSVNHFDWALANFLGDLRVKAASGGALRKFKTGSSGPDFPTIYGLMQCTPDLNEKDCNDCLQNATDQIRKSADQYPQLRHWTGWRILAPSCSLRYEANLFYNDTPPATSAAPPPAPPPARTFAPPPPSANMTTKQDNKSSMLRPTIVIVVVAVSISLVLTALTCVLLQLRKRKDVRNAKKLVGHSLHPGSVGWGPPQVCGGQRVWSGFSDYICTNAVRTPDLSEMDCNNCLHRATEKIPQYFNGKDDNTIRTVIITAVLTIGSVIGFIVCVCIFLRKRKQKKNPKQKVEVFEAWDQISIVELLEYDFETISVATNNFSNNNKLGQGGLIGVVTSFRPLTAQRFRSDEGRLDGVFQAFGFYCDLGAVRGEVVLMAAVFSLPTIFSLPSLCRRRLLHHLRGTVGFFPVADLYFWE